MACGLTQYEIVDGETYPHSSTSGKLFTSSRMIPLEQVPQARFGIKRERTECST